MSLLFTTSAGKNYTHYKDHKLKQIYLKIKKEENEWYVKYLWVVIINNVMNRLKW